MYGDTNILSILVSINLDLHSIQRLSMWGRSTMTSRLSKTKGFPVADKEGGDGSALSACSSPSSPTRWSTHVQIYYFSRLVFVVLPRLLI